MRRLQAAKCSSAPGEYLMQELSQAEQALAQERQQHELARLELDQRTANLQACQQKLSGMQRDLQVRIAITRVCDSLREAPCSQHVWRRSPASRF